MDSIFTKIIKREIPAEIIYEDEHTIVIPDKFPSMPGQLVVIAKKQVSYVFDLEEEDYKALMSTSRKVAKALDEALSTVRTCVLLEGFEVPHVHIKLYPCFEAKLTLTPQKEASDADLKVLAEKIKGLIK